MSKLTEDTVRDARQPGLHADGAGLYLSVTPRKDGSVSKSWVVRYTAPDGRRREMGLGSYPEIKLPAARRLATAKREQARLGVDPVAAKVQARRQAAADAARAMTFKECAEAYIAANTARWRNAKHAKQWSATLSTYAYPVFGHLPVGEIDTALVTKVLDPIWSAKPETARRLRGRIEAVLSWATVRGHRDGANPARWRGHLDMALPTIPLAQRVKHHAALPYAQIGEFMTKLRAVDGTSARALQFAILTAARTGEVLGARWAEMDLKQGVWTIPAARMKGGREHRVPLSAPALAILRDLQKHLPADDLPDFVFSGMKPNAPLSDMALLMTLRRMGRADLTVHGFRSTFRDWVADATAFSREIAEAALAHSISDRTEAAYRRGDALERRRLLMRAWGSFCGTATHEPAAVVPINASRRSQR